MSSANVTIPFHTFLLKVASRCNLDCDYCYVYHRGDDNWLRQPKLMSEETSSQICKRIAEHCDEHGKTDISILFHGGEPLMGGIRHLNKILKPIKEILIDRGINVNFGMQSNLVLFSREIGDLLTEFKFSIGISLDGNEEANRYRIDHRGRPSFSRVEKSLNLLVEEYPHLMSGFLAVINLENDPIASYEYLRTFKPRGIDFLYPLDNYERRPSGKNSFESTPYADWLIKIFDIWFANHTNMRMRYFDSIIRSICGGTSYVESIGITPVDLIVIETNGEIEAVDSLKAAYPGATKLGYNVFEHTFTSVAKLAEVQNRQQGTQKLCDTCQSCNIVKFCGGGYIPHRYSHINQYNNPSIYCRDIYKLTHHIYNAVQNKVDGIKKQLSLAT
jgi:uncharacterized protein